MCFLIFELHHHHHHSLDVLIGVFIILFCALIYQRHLKNCIQFGFILAGVRARKRSEKGTWRPAAQVRALLAPWPRPDVLNLDIDSFDLPLLVSALAVTRPRVLFVEMSVRAPRSLPRTHRREKLPSCRGARM